MSTLMTFYRLFANSWRGRRKSSRCTVR